MTATSIKLRTDRGVRYGLLVREERDRLYVILQEPRVHMRRLPLTDEQFITPIDCPVSKMQRSIRQTAKRHGCTLSRDVRDALKRGEA